MSDPFTVLPIDDRGKLKPGRYHFVKHGDLGKVKGWVPVELTDLFRAHHDDYSVLCEWVPWWKRILRKFKR